MAEAAWAPILSGALKEHLRAIASDVASDLHRRLSGEWNPLFVFDDLRAGDADQVVAVDAGHWPPGELWFLGDIHGDLLALECALWYINSLDDARNATVIFLGDLVDDGGDAHEVVIRVMQLMRDEPRKYCFLPGNHDEALRFDSAAQVYASSVDPSDYSTFLNRSLSDKAVTSVADTFVDLVARSPRALFFPDGLLAAHAGVPQRDLWDSLTDRASLNHPLCLQDFVWTRAHHKAPRRYADRTSRGAEFGRIDFEEFCTAASAARTAGLDDGPWPRSRA